MGKNKEYPLQLERVREKDQKKESDNKHKDFAGSFYWENVYGRGHRGINNAMNVVRFAVEDLINSPTKKSKAMFRVSAEGLIKLLVEYIKNNPENDDNKQEKSKNDK